MNIKHKITFKELLLITSAWVFIMYFYNLISFWAYRHIMQENVITEYFDSGYIHYEIWIQGILFGSLFLLIDKITDKRKIRRRSLGSVILIKSGLYILSFAIAGLATYTIYKVFDLLTEKQWEESVSFLTVNGAIGIGVYFIAAILFMNFLIQVNRKFGPGNLLNLILGKYHHPIDEKQIFMFLDLKGSTGIAEKLGHNKYSRLIQDCFFDLNDVLIKNYASVYQYVGDEVVLNWMPRKGFKELNCIKTYFDFIDKINKRVDYYNYNYGFVPYFKCGLDYGEVTASEIGDLKREIAYHGDVLNTAARIEKKCTPLNKQMIISEYLYEQLPKVLNGFSSELIGEFQLTGKSEEIKLYSVERKSD